MLKIRVQGFLSFLLKNLAVISRKIYINLDFISFYKLLRKLYVYILIVFPNLQTVYIQIFTVFKFNKKILKNIIKNPPFSL